MHTCLHAGEKNLYWSSEQRSETTLVHHTDYSAFSAFSGHSDTPLCAMIEL